MNKGKFIFAQIMEYFPRYEFQKCVEKYDGDRRIRSLSCWEQFLAMSFLQLSGTESMRMLILGFEVHQNKLYHLGFSGRKIARMTLREANEERDWKIYQDFAQHLIAKVRPLYTSDDTPFDFELENPVYALDSSTIDLCLSLFPWAFFRKRKSAIKMHTLLDLKGNIPSVIVITDGKTHDVHILDDLEIEMGAFYIMDRAYLDFKRLYDLHQKSAFFVTRTKKNFAWKRRYSHDLSEEAKEMGIRCDQTIFLTGYSTQKKYPEPLRCIKFWHEEKQKYLKFLTNNFALPAEHIVIMYKQRWQIELFFKWIKQHLIIKKFSGRSANAVKTQIWICVSVYLIIALIKKQLKIEKSPYEILHILKISLLDKTPLSNLFSDNPLQIDTGLFAKDSLELGI
jgi:hypothetical protein